MWPAGLEFDMLGPHKRTCALPMTHKSSETGKHLLKLFELSGQCRARPRASQGQTRHPALPPPHTAPLLPQPEYSRPWTGMIPSISIPHLQTGSGDEGFLHSVISHHWPCNRSDLGEAQRPALDAPSSLQQGTSCAVSYRVLLLSGTPVLLASSSRIPETSGKSLSSPYFPPLALLSEGFLRTSRGPGSSFAPHACPPFAPHACLPHHSPCLPALIAPHACPPKSLLMPAGLQKQTQHTPSPPVCRGSVEAYGKKVRGRAYWIKFRCRWHTCYHQQPLGHAGSPVRAGAPKPGLCTAHRMAHCSLWAWAWNLMQILSTS